MIKSNSTIRSSAMLIPYMGHAARYQTSAGIRLKKYIANRPMAAQTACFCRYFVEISYPVSYSLWAKLAEYSITSPTVSSASTRNRNG